MNNKKGMILYYFVIPGFVIALVYFIILSSYLRPVGGARFPGELQLGMFTAAQVAEETLVYVDEAAKIAAYRAVGKVADGKYAGSSCLHYGYVLWSEQCAVSIMGEFERIFNEEMRSLIAAYPQKDRYISISSDISLFPKLEFSYYKLFGRNHELVGATNVPLSLNLSFDNTLVGLYSIRPDFSVKTTYDFDAFRTIQSRLGELRRVERVDVRARLERAFPTWNKPSLRWEANACLPETAEELFWEVVEHVQWCMDSRKEDPIISCRCDLSRVDLSLLGENTISFEQGEHVVARLERNEASILDYTFGSDSTLGYHPSEELSIRGLQRSDKILLRWEGENSIFVGREQSTIAPKLSLFRNKVNEKDMLAFISTPRTELYEQFSECPLPDEKKLRLCVSSGAVPVYNKESRKMEQKPVTFKLAVELI